MPTNWRDETNYDYIENLDASGLAWECLRRNPDYRAAFPNMTENEAAAWGLRFPRRSRAQGDGR
ncbi:transcriptional regulator domain-containing protein [Aestuariibius sp. 2305UL40-4]|uniref:transcriptional regulator domain-containing protein n=1 Tax=Aestuariibius violaceus TaxID=3234132 RepID=UPI00345E21E2